MKERNYKERFMDGFNKLSHGSKSQYEVWQDVIKMFAISFANGSTSPLKDTPVFKDVWNKREQEYLRIIKKYNEREQKLLPQMLALLTMEYEQNPFQDLLGTIYMGLGINSKNKGQFFTPYSICEMMARMTMERKNVGKAVHKKGFVSINDPACGAGATLIASVEHCKERLFKKYNYQNHVYCVGQDVDETSALMCYLQLSMLPIAGYVTVGNTLAEPEVTDLNRIWFTPLWFGEVWVQRRFFHGYDLLMRKSKKGGTKK